MCDKITDNHIKNQCYLLPPLEEWYFPMMAVCTNIFKINCKLYYLIKKKLCNTLKEDINISHFNEYGMTKWGTEGFL